MSNMPDEAIIQKVTRQLSNRGMRSPCQIVVVARRGDVTLSGTIQYEHQRLAAMHAVRSIDGVRRVTDNMHVQAKLAPRPIMKTTAPAAEKTAPTTEKIAPAKEKIAPAAEIAAPLTDKTAPTDINR